MPLTAIPCYTGDIDVVIAVDPENVRKFCQVVAEFGFEGLELDTSVLTQKRGTLVFGVEPLMIQILPDISGLTFDECFSKKLRINYDGVELNLISREHLIANKLAARRPKHLSDVEDLQLRTDAKPESRQ